MSLLGGTYGSRELEISSNDAKRGDDCPQADLALLIPLFWDQITSGLPTIRPELLREKTSVSLRT